MGFKACPVNFAVVKPLITAKWKWLLLASPLFLLLF